MRLALARLDDGWLAFSVADDGPGVPAEARGRIADRFVRLENSRNQPGAGLGLSLVSAVAGAHGGRLELADGAPRLDGTDRAPGGGARLVLPPGLPT